MKDKTCFLRKETIYFSIYVLIYINFFTVNVMGFIEKEKKNVQGKIQTKVGAFDV